MASILIRHLLFFPHQYIRDIFQVRPYGLTSFLNGCRVFWLSSSAIVDASSPGIDGHLGRLQFGVLSVF